MTDKRENRKVIAGLKKQDKYFCGPETWQKCKAVSWAKAAAYQDLGLEAASDNWKFSSCGILRLNSSTQDDTKSSIWKPGSGADQSSWFPQDYLPGLALKPQVLETP